MDALVTTKVMAAALAAASLSSRSLYASLMLLDTSIAMTVASALGADTSVR
ncbi:MAG: hypothetical protein U0638_16510 [Phycisphaerales bacterium]